MGADDLPAAGLFTGDASLMAAYYDTYFLPGLFSPWAEDLVDRLPMQPGDRVLDIACGTGALSAALAARLTAGSVLGTDLAPAMLELARAKGIPRAEFQLADALDLPVGDGTFDGVTCQQGLQFMPDRSRAVAEMRRALRPGGWVAIACWTRTSDQMAMNAFALGLERRGWAAAGAAIRVAFSFGDAEQLADVASANGFTDVRVETVTRDVTLPPAAEFARGYVQVPPYLQYYAGATDAEREAFVADVAAQLAEHSDDKATVGPMRSNVLVAVAA